MATDKAPVAEASPSDTAFGFFYGTLMAPEVFYTVCYRLSKPPAELVAQHPFQDAILKGYTRHRVRLADYPAIVPDDAPGASVRGMLVGGLSPANMHQLDFFEGSEYDRRTVEVELLSGERKEAQVYVFNAPDRLERAEWDFDEFRRDKMRTWTRADLTFEGESTANASASK